MRTVTRAAVATLVAMVALLVVAVPAQAHSELVKATPADGSTWKQLPKSGTLTFAGEVEAAEVEVRAGDEILPVTAVAGDAHSIRYALTGVEATGAVVISWDAVDVHDGHRSGGWIRLHVTGPADTKADDSGAAAGPTDSDPLMLDWLDTGSRALGYLGMVLLVGGLLFLALLWPEGAQVSRVRRLLATSVAAGLVAAIGSAGAVLWRASEQPVGDVLATDYGRAASAMVLLWVLAAVVVAGVLQLDTTAVRGVAWRVGAIIVSFGLIRVTGINAHATQGDDRTVGAIADFLHLLAVSAWAGGLVMLTVCVLPRASTDEVAQVVPRFSRVALLAVATLVSSGLLLLWDISRGIEGFWTTHYSRVLIIKLALFSLVILVAMKSRRWVQTALAEAVTAHRRTAVRSFAVSVATETVLVIAVLAAASVLVTSSPGR